MGGSRASAASSTSHSTSIQFIFIRGRLASIIVRRSLFFDHGASNMEPRSLCFDDFPAGKYAPPQKTTPGELARLPALPFITLSGAHAHLMRTLSQRRKRVRVNVTSSAYPPSALEPWVPEPVLASARVERERGAAGAID